MQSFTHYFYNYKNKDINDLYLNESFKDAQKVFSQQANPIEVKQTLDDFKSLSQQNKIKGDDRDITKWMKKPFDDLKSLVDKSKSVITKRQHKLSIGKDAIKVTEFGNWLVVIPQTEEASCKYGSGTKWCTAATTSKNWFNTYTREHRILLIYFINNQSNDKYAAALALNDNQDLDGEFFDKNDSPLSKDEMSKEMNISIEVLDDLLLDSIVAYDARKLPIYSSKEIIDKTKELEKDVKDVFDVGSKLNQNISKDQFKTLLNAYLIPVYRNARMKIQTFRKELLDDNDNRTVAINALEILLKAVHDIDKVRKTFQSYEDKFLLDDLQA